LLELTEHQEQSSECGDHEDKLKLQNDSEIVSGGAAPTSFWFFFLYIGGKDYNVISGHDARVNSSMNFAIG
jgi:hypothetical protein